MSVNLQKLCSTIRNPVRHISTVWIWKTKLILTHLTGFGLLCMVVTGVAMRRPCLSFFHCLKAILRDERCWRRWRWWEGGNGKKTTQTQIDTHGEDKKSRRVQGDTSRWFKPPVDINTKIPFWPDQVMPGQAKTELLFWCQREVWINVMCHPVNKGQVFNPDWVGFYKYRVC